ncbi:MAG TPA: protein kinase [Gemmatimonadales bacterium]|nr:protein kinase [Gemmatimonadales bacterium]
MCFPAPRPATLEVPVSGDQRDILAQGLTGRYRIERELGRGGMATVYLAHDLRHDRPVALKVLHPELAATLGPERFDREIRVAARLQHPHILTVLDSGDTAGQLWFTMPFVEGETLRDRMRREGQLPIGDAVLVARETAEALDYAHQHGIVHRDVKPENILLTGRHALVADFGIARALGAGPGASLTETGMSLGTPAYMSPEQASGDRSVDARSDVYSLGCVLYEMLAGEVPITGPTAQAILVRKFTETPRPLRTIRETVPEGLEQVVAKALARSPADRYASAAELAQALDGVPAATSIVTPTAVPTVAVPRAPAASGVGAGAHGVGSRDAGSPRSIARRYPLTIALALGFAIGLGVLFAWRRTRAPAEDETAGPKRLAVLPFENLGDSSSDYFADGMTDEVRGKLSALPGLTVIASQSSGAYKHSAKPLPEIARELGVNYVLTGKVRWEKGAAAGSRVRVSPELVEVSSEGAPTTKWQQPFDANLTDVFQVQADIAGRVADALNVALGATQKQTLAEKPTANVAAYDAYLKGEAASQHIGVTDPASLGEAIGYYEQAVALDSTFLQAWAELARANAWYYGTSTPTPSAAEAAKRAADRAVRLGPGHPESQLALGDYHSLVRFEYAEALAAYQAGLRIAPANADLLTASALVEQSLGRWDSALVHLQRAQAIDPRSVQTARRLAATYIWLRRYPEAIAAADRAIAIAPTNLAVVEYRAMASLAQGDLAGARAVIRAVPAEVEPTALAAYFGTYADLGWALDDAQQQLLLRLPPSAFADDRGNWGLVLAQVYGWRGDLAKARIYADSARIAFEEHLRAAPEDPQQRALYGLALAYLGRKADAIREGQRGVALLPVSKDGFAGPYMQHQLARIYILTGEPEKALDQLEPLLKIPYNLSPGLLRIDPDFDPLRKNPRFERLVAGQ